MLSFSHSILCLSGALQDTGGVGALLAVIRDGEAYAPAYDANGNVSEYVSLSTGAIVAHYEYSPFGEVTAQSGSIADDFKFRFSTKYFENETGILHYERRPNSPSLGRWMNRDSIEERGGLNLYGFLRNDPLKRIDYLGFFSNDDCNFMAKQAAESISGYDWESVVGLPCAKCSGPRATDIKFLEILEDEKPYLGYGADPYNSVAPVEHDGKKWCKWKFRGEYGIRPSRKKTTCSFRIVIKCVSETTKEIKYMYVPDKGVLERKEEDDLETIRLGGDHVWRDFWVPCDEDPIIYLPRQFGWPIGTRGGEWQW